MSIDRQSRNILAEAVHKLVNGQDPMKNCDIATVMAVRQSQDPVVRYFNLAIADMDYDEHWYVDGFTKAEWDHHQRLILLLQSNAQIVATRRWHWSWTQLTAAFALALLIAGIYFSKSWANTIVVLLLGQAIAEQISQTFHRWPIDDGLVPFDSFATLRAARVATPHFEKQRFEPRKPTVLRRIFMAYEAALLIVNFLFNSPIRLFDQMFPCRKTAATVIVPD